MNDKRESEVPWKYCKLTAIWFSCVSKMHEPRLIASSGNDWIVVCPVCDSVWQLVFGHATTGRGTRLRWKPLSASTEFVERLTERVKLLKDVETMLNESSGYG